MANKKYTTPNARLADNLVHANLGENSRNDFTAKQVVNDELNDDRIAWSSFALLDQAIDEIFDDPKEVVSEREAFLLRELQEMFEAEGLLANPNDIVVVAARSAWQEYNDIHGTAFTMSQRYVSSEELVEAKTTSDLD